MDVAGLSAEEMVISRHGVAYINTKPLFYPESTTVFGAYPVNKFDGQQLLEKTNRVSISQDVIKNSAVLNSKAPTDKEGRMSIVSKRPTDPDHHTAVAIRPHQPDPGVTMTAETEQRMYEECRSYLYAEIRLQKTLSEPVNKEEVIEKLRTVLRPATSPLLTQEQKAAIAEEAVRKQLEKVVALIGEKYGQVGTLHNV